ncbi:MAG: hypothetical protein U0350_12220 [Caldilineaceae bacterium]
MDSVRINIRRLITSILVSLVLPLGLAILLDYSLGWTPFTTIGASLIFIPLSTVIVTRVALAELDQVIQRVAPLDPDPAFAPDTNLDVHLNENWEDCSIESTVTKQEAIPGALAQGVAQEAIAV